MVNFKISYEAGCFCKKKYFKSEKCVNHPANHQSEVELSKPAFSHNFEYERASHTKQKIYAKPRKQYTQIANQSRARKFVETQRTRTWQRWQGQTSVLLPLSNLIINFTLCHYLLLPYLIRVGILSILKPTNVELLACRVQQWTNIAVWYKVFLYKSLSLLAKQWMRTNSKTTYTKLSISIIRPP